MIGEYIKDKREKMGLTQRDFAKQIGISLSSISLIEKNKRRIGKNKIEDFARVLETTKDEIIANNIIPHTIEKERKNQAKVFKVCNDLDELIKATEETLVYLKKARDTMKLANIDNESEEDI